MVALISSQSRRNGVMTTVSTTCLDVLASVKCAPSCERLPG